MDIQLTPATPETPPMLKGLRQWLAYRLIPKDTDSLADMAAECTGLILRRSRHDIVFCEWKQGVYGYTWACWYGSRENPQPQQISGPRRAKRRQTEKFHCNICHNLWAPRGKSRRCPSCNSNDVAPAE